MKRSSAFVAEARDDAGLRRRRDDAAPRDLQRHPHGLRPRRLADPSRQVTDHADVLVLLIRVDAGRVRHRIDVDTGDVERRAVRHEACNRPARRLHDHERVVGIERIHLAVTAREVRGRHRAGRVEGIPRLVLAFPCAERRMLAEALDDARQHALGRRRGTGRQVRERAEPDPACETVRAGRVELRALRRNLSVELLLAPVRDSGAHHRHTRVGDLLEPVGRRAVREDDRERHPPQATRRAAESSRYSGRSSPGRMR